MSLMMSHGVKKRKKRREEGVFLLELYYSQSVQYIHCISSAPQNHRNQKLKIGDKSHITLLFSSTIKKDNVYICNTKRTISQ
jgi:hypothetical protein